jgi:hypothetical protein
MHIFPCLIVDPAKKSIRKAVIDGRDLRSSIHQVLDVFTLPGEVEAEGESFYWSGDAGDTGFIVISEAGPLETPAGAQWSIGGLHFSGMGIICRWDSSREAPLAGPGAEEAMSLVTFRSVRKRDRAS